MSTPPGGKPAYPEFPPWSELPGPPLTPAQLEAIRNYLQQNPLPISQIPGFAGLYVSGRVAANGQVNAGHHFSVDNTSAGIYVITYSRPFGDEREPFVAVTLIGEPIQDGGAVVCGLTAHSRTGCTVRWQIAGGTDTNQSFMFYAYAIQN